MRKSPAAGGLGAAQPGPFTLVTLRAGAITLEFGTLGAGTPVILVPGRGGAGTEQFGALGQALAEAGFQAVAVNLRGVGGSSGPLEDLSLHDLAADLAAVINAFAGRAHLVGRALGNRIVRCLAADAPAQVLSLVLLAAGGLVPPAAGPRAGARSILDRADRAVRYRHWQAAGLAHERAATATPRAAWWPGGAAPMLVVQGLADTIAVPENGRQLAAAYPQRVRLIEVEGAGHMLLAERPDVVIPAVVSYLQEMARTAAAPDSRA